MFLARLWSFSRFQITCRPLGFPVDETASLIWRGTRLIAMHTAYSYRPATVPPRPLWSDKCSARFVLLLTGLVIRYSNGRWHRKAFEETDIGGIRKRPRDRTRYNSNTRPSWFTSVEPNRSNTQPRPKQYMQGLQYTVKTEAIYTGPLIHSQHRSNIQGPQCTTKTGINTQLNRSIAIHGQPPHRTYKPSPILSAVNLCVHHLWIAVYVVPFN